MAEVVVAVHYTFPSLVYHEVRRIVLGDNFGVFIDKVPNGLPKRRYRFRELIQRHDKPVLFVILPHKFEWVIVEVAIVFSDYRQHVKSLEYMVRCASKNRTSASHLVDKRNHY